jgi:hypothetical protein
LLGVLVLTVAITRTRVAEAAVQTVAQLDAARSGVEHEVVPVLSLAAMSDPTAAAALGLTPLMVAAQQQLAATAESQARATTERASVPAGSVGAVAAEQAAAQLAALRERADIGQFG